MPEDRETMEVMVVAELNERVRDDGTPLRPRAKARARECRASRMEVATAAAQSGVPLGAEGEASG